MNKDDEINQQLKDIDKKLFAIGIMVVGIGGMCIGIIGILALGIL